MLLCVCDCGCGICLVSPEHASGACLRFQPPIHTLHNPAARTHHNTRRGHQLPPSTTHKQTSKRARTIVWSRSEASTKRGVGQRRSASSTPAADAAACWHCGCVCRGHDPKLCAYGGECGAHETAPERAALRSRRAAKGSSERARALPQQGSGEPLTLARARAKKKKLFRCGARTRDPATYDRPRRPCTDDWLLCLPP